MVMAEEKMIEQLKCEHNKTTGWIIHFNHRLDEINEHLLKMDQDVKDINEKQEILAHHVLKLIKK